MDVTTFIGLNSESEPLFLDRLDDVIDGSKKNRPF